LTGNGLLIFPDDESPIIADSCGIRGRPATLFSREDEFGDMLLGLVSGDQLA